MQTYLNWSGPSGRETVDAVHRDDFPCEAAYRSEVRRLCEEYALAGMAVHPSARPCAGW